MPHCISMVVSANALGTAALQERRLSYNTMELKRQCLQSSACQSPGWSNKLSRLLPSSSCPNCPPTEMQPKWQTDVLREHGSASTTMMKIDPLGHTQPSPNLSHPGHSQILGCRSKPNIHTVNVRVLASQIYSKLNPFLMAIENRF